MAERIKDAETVDEEELAPTGQDPIPEEEQYEDDLEPATLTSQIFPVYVLACIFLISQFLALIIAPQFIDNDVRATEKGSEGSLSFVVVFLAMIIVFTAVILYLTKLKKKDLIHYLILFVFGWAILTTSWPIFAFIMPVSMAQFLGFVLGACGVYLFYKFPEWYVIDTFGILLCAGIGATYGISLTPTVVIVFLSLAAIYDALAVYKTKHMIDVADVAMEKKLPLMFVVPKEFPYTFLDQVQGIKESLEKGTKREAMFMGLGDVALPTLLVVSAVTFLDPESMGEVFFWGIPGPFVVAFAVMAGTLAGYFALIFQVLKGQAHAGLPLLNGGAISGYLLATFLLYGEFGLSFTW